MPGSSLGKNVLIIEDDDSIRETLALYLETEGYSAKSARNGKEGLEFLHDDGSPCLILVDLKMPDFDGWNFLEAKESFGLAHGVPVVVMSASKPDRPIPGNHTFLPKPIDGEHLLSVVKMHCVPANPSPS